VSDPQIEDTYWTRDVPTQPGWYWVKLDGRDVMVIVAFDRDGIERPPEIEPSAIPPGVTWGSRIPEPSIEP